MCEKIMYTCMCNWVTILYSREKMYWGNKKKFIKKIHIENSYSITCGSEIVLGYFIDNHYCQSQVKTNVLSF